MLSHTKRHDRFDNAHSVVKFLPRTFAGGFYVETSVGFCEETYRVWINFGQTCLCSPHP